MALKKQFITNMAATQIGFDIKMKLFLGLAAFYLLTDLGFALSTNILSLLLILVVVMVSGFLAAQNADPAGRKRQQARSALQRSFIWGVFATLFLPIPELGITRHRGHNLILHDLVHCIDVLQAFALVQIALMSRINPQVPPGSPSLQVPGVARLGTVEECFHRV
ncbi:MAG: hypothetical protein ACFHXK_06220 [bacterium]